MSLYTQRTGRELGELDLATKTWRIFGNLEEPEEDSARIG